MTKRRELITTAGILFLAGCSSDEEPADNTNNDQEDTTEGDEPTVDPPDLTLIDYEQVEPAAEINSENPEIVEYNNLGDEQELLIQGMFELPNGCYESELRRVDLSGTTLRYHFVRRDTSDENTACTQQIQQIRYRLKVTFSGESPRISISARHPEESYNLRYNLSDDN
jgi:hypothetical protein